MNRRIWFQASWWMYMFALMAGVSVSLSWSACQTSSKQPPTAPIADRVQILSDSALFDTVQKYVLGYFTHGAEPVSGLAAERIHMDNEYPQKDSDVVTSGGTGFGIMALIVGIERGFITRSEGIKRLDKIISFLERADRYHGVWPHWWHGPTGKTKPFSKKDDGGDLVETSFVAQGLLCLRQYFSNGTAVEIQLAERADNLWKTIEFNWHQHERNGDQVLLWHWSPQYGWEMNFDIRGYNECLITYILAVSSPTYGVPAEVYHEGWASRGKISHKQSYKNDTLQLRQQGNHPFGGPLFWVHYSFLGLDPRGLRDRYADYEKEVKAYAHINYQWCVDHATGTNGYGPDNWGLTASYSPKGYAAHAPGTESDLGVITPTAALSSFPYTPAQSTAAMRYWYENLNSELWGSYGFYDAFSKADNWYPQHYLAIDQGPIVIMMENHRSGLLWQLFMSCPEIQTGLKKCGFESPYIK